ncbi:hypothetical protein BESB_008340 [Besnoitia besnoiti]|uniref:Uncharacterized protein n=1 Tax=Besnoitia besnoiti TaxID=94643 RepID=A0A2A9MQU8_BESBE|nr:hypothetical protein BESB_008340 [Besnoitia besnoiti]PFH38492.1 hypothetical protein BESB_008340 [Besnoitia besnoiti]
MSPILVDRQCGSAYNRHAEISDWCPVRVHSTRHLVSAGITPATTPSDRFFLLTHAGRSQVKALLASADHGNLLEGAPNLKTRFLEPPLAASNSEDKGPQQTSQQYRYSTGSGGATAFPPAGERDQETWARREEQADDDDDGRLPDACVQLDEPFLLPLLLRFLGVSMYGRLCCVSKSLKEACEGRCRKTATAATWGGPGGLNQDPRDGAGGLRHLTLLAVDEEKSSAQPVFNSHRGTTSYAPENSTSSSSIICDDAFFHENGDFWLTFLRDHFPGSFNEELELLESSRHLARGGGTAGAVGAVAARQLLRTAKVARQHAQQVARQVELLRQSREREEMVAAQRLRHEQDQAHAHLVELADGATVCRARMHCDVFEPTQMTGAPPTLRTAGDSAAPDSDIGSGRDTAEPECKYRKIFRSPATFLPRSCSVEIASSAAENVGNDVGSGETSHQAGSAVPSFAMTGVCPLGQSDDSRGPPADERSLGARDETCAKAPLLTVGLNNSPQCAAVRQGQTRPRNDESDGTENGAFDGWRIGSPSVTMSGNRGSLFAESARVTAIGLSGSPAVVGRRGTKAQSATGLQDQLPKDQVELRSKTEVKAPLAALWREGSSRGSGRPYKTEEDIDPLLLCVSARLTCMILVTSSKTAEKWRQLDLIVGWLWFQRNVLRRMTLSQLRRWMIKRRMPREASPFLLKDAPRARISCSTGELIELPDQVEKSGDHIAWKMTTKNWELLYESVQLEMGYRARMLAEKLFQRHQGHIDDVGNLIEDRLALEQHLLCLPVFCGDVPRQATTCGSQPFPARVPPWRKCVSRLRSLFKGAFSLLQGLNEAWDDYEEWAEMTCQALDCLDFRITQEREACDQRWPHTPNLGDVAKLQFRTFCVFDSRLMHCICASVYALIHELEEQRSRSSAIVSGWLTTAWSSTSHHAEMAGAAARPVDASSGLAETANFPQETRVATRETTLSRARRASTVELFEASMQRLDELDVADDGLSSRPTREEFQKFIVTPIKGTSSRLSNAAWCCP